MKLGVLKVSFPVLVLMIFQTGNCGVFGELAKLRHQMSSMTPQQQIRADEEFWARVEGRPVQPAPAPQPATVSVELVPQTLAAPVQTTPAAQTVSVQSVSQQLESVASPEPALTAAPEVQSSDQEENSESAGSRFFNIFRHRSAKNKKVSQGGSATEQSIDDSASFEVESGLEDEILANAETVIQSNEGGAEESKDVRKTADENEESESSSASWLQKMFNRPSREGSIVDEESSQSEISSDEESEDSDRE